MGRKNIKQRGGICLHTPTSQPSSMDSESPHNLLITRRVTRGKGARAVGRSGTQRARDGGRWVGAHGWTASGRVGGEKRFARRRAKQPRPHTLGILILPETTCYTVYPLFKTLMHFQAKPENARNAQKRSTTETSSF
eukprot:2619446-Alexandrium_andersonii.AAC.1